MQPIHLDIYFRLGVQVGGTRGKEGLVSHFPRGISSYFLIFFHWNQTPRSTPFLSFLPFFLLPFFPCLLRPSSFCTQTSPRAPERIKPLFEVHSLASPARGWSTAGRTACCGSNTPGDQVGMYQNKLGEESV